MHNDMKEYFRAYRLVWKRDSYTKGWKNEYHCEGLCILEQLTEAESIEELLYTVPVKRMLYDVEKKNNGIIKDFTIKGDRHFSSLDIKMRANSCRYCSSKATDRKPQIALERVYENFLGEIILVMNTWVAAQVTEMEIYFQKWQGKRYGGWFGYRLQFDGTE